MRKKERFREKDTDNKQITDNQWVSVARGGLEPPTFPIEDRDALTPWVATGVILPLL